jgi:hypothetical protein
MFSVFLDEEYVLAFPAERRSAARDVRLAR